MSLKKKIFLFFLFVSLTPLVVVGLFTFDFSKKLIVKKITQSLEFAATNSKIRLNEKIENHLEFVKLITSRNQLRVSIEALEGELTDEEKQENLQKITNIITSAKNSTFSIEHVSVINLEGIVIVSTDELEFGKNYKNEEFFVEGQKVTKLYDIFKDENNQLRLNFVGPFISESKNIIGVVQVISKADSILKITEDYTGLGDTGEIILAKKNSLNDAVFLTPLRFDSGAALNKAVPKEDVHVPVTFALQKKEITMTEPNIVDYRGKKVLAVTKYIESLDWGLVAKIDKSEAFAPIVALQIFFSIILFITMVGTVLFAWLIVNSIIKPIRKLTNFAHKLHKGKFSLQIKVKGHDEISYLGRTLNSLAKQIKESYGTLEEKVKKRTFELEHEKAKDEAVIKSVGEGMVVTDVKGNISLVNNEFEELTGFSTDEVIGENIFEVMRAHDENGKKIPPSKDLVRLVLSSKSGKTKTGLFKYYNASGKTFFARLTVSSIIFNGGVAGTVLVFRDVTKEQEIDKAKTEFVSLASHQLRTPLSAINWCTEIILSGDVGKLTKGQKKYLADIYEGNKRMVNLVNSLLDVSRLDLGTFAVNPSKMSIKKEVKSVLRELEPMKQEKKLVVKTKFSKLIPLINADVKLVRIIAQNLLSNAMKYTPEKGLIEVVLEKVKKGKIIEGVKAKKDSILFAVKDTGYGIPKEQHNQIFKKLFRADNVKNHGIKGTGLGLYIIKSIVESTKGQVWFSSPYKKFGKKSKEENKGTAFFVLFPVAGMKKKKGNKELGD